MRTVAITIALLKIGASGVSAAPPLIWLPYAEALQRAKAEEKILLVDLRGPCGADEVGCGVGADRFIAESAMHVPLRRAYSSFILARAYVDPTASSEEVAKLAAQSPPIPSFALVDFDGTLIATWARSEALSFHLHFLNLARDEIPAMVRARAARQRGAMADSDLLLAEVDMRMLHVIFARANDSRARLPRSERRGSRTAPTRLTSPLRSRTSISDKGSPRSLPFARSSAAAHRASPLTATWLSAGFI